MYIFSMIIDDWTMFWMIFWTIFWTIFKMILSTNIWMIFKIVLTKWSLNQSSFALFLIYFRKLQSENFNAVL